MLLLRKADLPFLNCSERSSEDGKQEDVKGGGRVFEIPHFHTTRELRSVTEPSVSGYILTAEQGNNYLELGKIRFTQPV